MAALNLKKFLSFQPTSTWVMWTFDFKSPKTPLENSVRTNKHLGCMAQTGSLER